jgi:hypothetical protein
MGGGGTVRDVLGPAQNLDADPDPDPDPGGGGGRGGRSAKNVHSPWQNPRYALGA